MKIRSFLPCLLVLTFLPGAALTCDATTVVVTNLADSGPGTLRQAITAAQSGDVITFATNGTIVLTSGGLTISVNLTIAGPGPENLALDGNQQYTVLVIPVLRSLSLSDLTITNGHLSGLANSSGTLTVNHCTISGNSAEAAGGGIYNLNGTVTINNSILSADSDNTIAGVGGGGIYNYHGTMNPTDGFITLSNCTIINNSTATSGGGIRNIGGTVAIVDCNLLDNSATNSGGGISNEGGLVTINDSIFSGNAADLAYHATSNLGGGGIFNGMNLIAPGAVAGSAALTNCTLAGNSSGLGGISAIIGQGGGIYTDTNSTLTLRRCMVSGNSASQSGGGIYCDTNSAITLNECTLSGNFATERGGGIYSYQGSVMIGNSTFSGNSASNNAGGGIYASGNSSRLGALTINGSTFANNSSSASGGAINCGFSIVALNNCTLSGNSAGSGAGGVQQGLSVAGAICTLTNTIAADNTPPSLKGPISGANNLTNGNPLLASLGDYGGPTQTMPPLFGSPAMDTGDDLATSFLATDQRGSPRLSGAHVDIGAVEAQLAPANPPPHLMNAAWSAGGGTNRFQFMFTNVPDADFTVLATTNLALALSQWIVLAPALQGSPGQYQFTDNFATNYPQRFYRAVSP